MTTDSTYLLGDILNRYVGDSRPKLYRLANHLGVYPAMLTALQHGEVIASASLRQGICEALQLTDEQTKEVQANNSEYMQKIQQQDPAKATVMRVLGDTTKETPLIEVMISLTNDFYLKMDKQVLCEKAGLSEDQVNSIMDDARDVGRELRRRRNYKPSIVKKVAAALPVGSHAQELFTSMGTNRKIPEMLEEYALSGGTTWPGFLQYIMDDWGWGRDLLAKELGVSNSRLSTWRAYDADKHDGEPLKVYPNKLDEISQKLKLTPQQEDYLWGLGRGDLKLGVTFEDAIERLQKDMAKLETATEREAFAATCFQTLLERRGQSFSSLTKVPEIGKSVEASLSRQASSKEPYEARWIPLAGKVAKALCPSDASPELVRDTSLLLLGVPYYRTPQQMYDSMVRGGMTAGEMAREYRLHHGVSTSEFAEIMGASSRDVYKRCEGTTKAKPVIGVIQNLAEHMGLDEDQTRVFIEASRGLKMHPKSEIMSTVQAALRGDKTFPDVLEQILSEKYAYQTAVNASGAALLARDLGYVCAEPVQNWREGTTIKDLAKAEKLAEIAGIPEAHIDEFIKLATGNVVKREPIKTIPQLVQSLLLAGDDVVEQSKILTQLMERADESYESLARKFRLEPEVVQNFMEKGLSEVKEFPIGHLSTILVPDNASGYRKAFCEHFISRTTTYQPAIMDNANVLDDEAQRAKVAKALLHQSGLDKDELEYQLGAFRDEVHTLLNEGNWSSKEVSITELANALIPDSYPAHREKFAEIFGRAGELTRSRAGQSQEVAAQL